MKREFKGTKTKWVILKKGFIEVKSDDVSICAIAMNGKQDENSKLIATAPELLECLMDLENDNGSIPKPIWDKIQKTIDKALGL